MNVVVLYDTVSGNTEQIARAVGDALRTGSTTIRLERAGDRLPSVAPGDLLVIGSPTHAGKPSAALRNLFRRVLAGALSGVRVAVFDTRFAETGQSFGLRLVMTFFGFAAPPPATGA